MENKGLKTYIVIPAYNEERKIGAVLDSLLSSYPHAVVVNDCSSDSTSAIARKREVAVIDHVINRGQGAALETGDAYALEAGADIIVHFDADGQFRVEDIATLVAPIISGRADIVTGSRFMGGEQGMPAFKKHFIMPIARFFLKLFYGVALSDPQNGFRAMDRRFASALKIENDGAAHCTEILARALGGGWRHLEVPVSIRYDEFGQGIFGGKGRGTGAFKILKSLLLQKLIR